MRYATLLFVFITKRTLKLNFFLEQICYEESCECARLSEIVGGIGGRPVTMIRFNPDSSIFFHGDPP